MNGSFFSVVLKGALFLAICCLVMLFLVDPFSAEWYIMIISLLLDASVCVFGTLAARSHKKKQKGGKDHEID